MKIKLTPTRQNIFGRYANQVKNNNCVKILSKSTSNNAKISDRLEIGITESPKQKILSQFNEYLNQTNKIDKSDIDKILAHGGLSIVFKHKNGNEVIKVSLENPLQYRNHNPNFDIPFLAPVEKFKNIYIIREPKAKTENLTTNDVKKVIDKIKKAGFETSRDLTINSTRQIGIYKGEAYLLDTRCAMPRPNIFSRFVYDFCEKHQKAIILKNILDVPKENLRLEKDYNPLLLHIDETPRKNLSFTAGMKMLLNCINENINYYSKILTLPKSRSLN